MKSISSTACISIALIVSIAGTDVKWGPVQIYNLIDGSPSYQPYRMEPATGTKALYDYLIEHDYDIMAAVDVVGDKMSPVGDDPNGSCVRQTRAYAPYTDSGIDTTLMAKPIFSDTPNGNDMLELLAHTVGTGFPPPIPHSGKTPYKAVLLSTSSKPRYNKDDMATPNPDLASHFNCALDYPGLEQVGKILRDSGVYIHAGVTDEVYEEWEDLFYNKLKLEKETTSVGRIASDHTSAWHPKDRVLCVLEHAIRCPDDAPKALNTSTTIKAETTTTIASTTVIPTEKCCEFCARLYD